MGNRSYLLAVGESKNRLTILESNNSISLFWPMLFDAEDFLAGDRFLGRETALVSTLIGLGQPFQAVVSSKRARENLYKRSSSVNTLLPECVDLFTAWRRYLDAFEAEAFLLDFSEYSWFFDSGELCIEDLRRLVMCWEQPNLFAREALLDHAGLSTDDLHNNEYQWLIVGDATEFQPPWEALDDINDHARETPEAYMARHHRFQAQRRRATLSLYEQERLQAELGNRDHHLQRALEAEAPGSTRHINAARYCLIDALKAIGLNYAGGAEPGALCEGVETAVQAMETFHRTAGDQFDELDLSIDDMTGHMASLWLVGLTHLLARPDLTARMIALLEPQLGNEPGRHLLLRSIIGQLGGQVPSTPPGLDTASLGPLTQAMLQVDPDSASVLIQSFLDGFCQRAAGTEWLEEGSGLPAATVWCFEAALVTVLRDIDDISYRDHPLYPAALVYAARNR